jgi:hypothetical protein
MLVPVRDVGVGVGSGFLRKVIRKRIGTRIAADSLVLPLRLSAAHGSTNEVSVEVSDESHAQSALAFTYQVGRFTSPIGPTLHLRLGRRFRYLWLPCPGNPVAWLHI